MTNALDTVEQLFEEKNIRFRRSDDAIEVSFYGYPIAERYRVVYLDGADAVLVSSHGIAYPRAGQEQIVQRTVLTWNHETMGACWSFDKDTRGICADSTLYLGGQPLSSTQFERHFNGLVNQVRGKLPELLRLVIEEPGSNLDAAVKAQLEKILQQQNEPRNDNQAEEGPSPSLDAPEAPDAPDAPTGR
ncbi:MAG: hypothetical protein U0556_01565 [Dehalococcoidia bacterium]